jgi:hypothetical protein
MGCYDTTSYRSDTMNDWLEDKATDLITRACQSEWKRDIFDDARRFVEDGYVQDVALAMSCHYWLS